MLNSVDIFKTFLICFCKIPVLKGVQRMPASHASIHIVYYKEMSFHLLDDLLSMAENMSYDLESWSHCKLDDEDKTS